MIGQYDTYTNIQLVQYACTLANGGKRIQPHLLLDSYTTDEDGEIQVNYEANTNVLDDVSNQATAFSQIKQGMRACVTRTEGTAHSWNSKPYVTYAKTGTAEDYTTDDGKTGTTDYPNHLQIGYVQTTEDSRPEVAFACMSYRQTTATSGSSSAPIVAQAVIDRYWEKYHSTN